MTTSLRTEEQAAYARALASARARVIKGEGVHRYIVREPDGFGGFEISSVPGWVYEEQYTEDQCLAVVWSYRDDDGQIKAHTETQSDW
jgi:hypothetical protein